MLSVKEWWKTFMAYARTFGLCLTNFFALIKGTASEIYE
jgi:hypothetical protein